MFLRPCSPVFSPSTATPTPLTGIRLNPCATPLWGGPSGHLADATPNTQCSLILISFTLCVHFLYSFEKTYRFGALVFARFGLAVPSRQASLSNAAKLSLMRDCKSQRSRNSAAATSRLRFVNITRSGRALREAASSPSRTTAQLRITRSRSEEECTHFVFLI